MYSWGSDLYGQLGHGTGSSAKSRAESSVRSILATLVSSRELYLRRCYRKRTSSSRSPTLASAPLNSLFALHFFLQGELPNSSLGPEDSMLSTPLTFDEGERKKGTVTRDYFEKSMRNLHSPLRMPRGKVGPKIELETNRRQRPEPKMKGAPVRKQNVELTNEVNAFIAGVANRLNESAMLYSPARLV